MAYSILAHITFQYEVLPSFLRTLLLVLEYNRPKTNTFRFVSGTFLRGSNLVNLHLLRLIFEEINVFHLNFSRFKSEFLKKSITNKWKTKRGCTISQDWILNVIDRYFPDSHRIFVFFWVANLFLSTHTRWRWLSKLVSFKFHAKPNTYWWATHRNIPWENKKTDYRERML